ncbi:hypothetical protein H5410_032270 [Solanum commersonii]|uniref:Reverse transcriptase zinc-binding domain-containing protein n=1 Tax=Solanum commersonii TaxID=4109 RepID=A0A9J5YP64_SOLCO|nr:hypothetical protein H5410_032270 [Solanum commersonii]
MTPSTSSAPPPLLTYHRHPRPDDSRPPPESLPAEDLSTESPSIATRKGKLWEEFSQHKHFTVGNGLHIRFWRDKWLCNTVLMDDYPGLFYLARDPDSTISQNRDGTTWSIMFRNMQDWEFNELIKLLQTLQSFSLNTQATDQFKWGTTGAGNYTVSATYKQSRALNAVTDHWPWKLIWKIKLPPKIICFCWTALYEA